MREFHFIHSAEDVSQVLGLASALGLIIRCDDPSVRPIPDIVDPKTIPDLKEGVFMVFQPNWIFGPLRYNLIDTGHRKGLYSQMPSTNCASLLLSFQIERKEEGINRLGSGLFSRDTMWYRPEDHSVHPAPPEIKAVFDNIRKKLDTKKYIEAGGRRYTILPRALEKLTIGSHRPPFDFMDAEPIHGLVSQPRP